MGVHGRDAPKILRQAHRQDFRCAEAEWHNQQPTEADFYTSPVQRAKVRPRGHSATLNVLLEITSAIGLFEKRMVRYHVA